MKKVLHTFLALFSCINSFAQGNTPQTISMAAGTNNSTAFSTQGTIGADGAALTFYTHWDATYLYLGWTGGSTNYSSDMYYAAIDTDPNGTNGITNPIEGVSFTNVSNTRKPDYYVVYENNSSFYGLPTGNGDAFEVYNNNATNWTFVSRTSPGNNNSSGRVVFSGSNAEVRLRIAWSTLGFTPGSTTPIAITMWTNNSSGNFMWSRFPTENTSTGSTPKTLGYSFVFYNTSSGVNPSTAKVIENNTFTTSSFSGTQNLGLTISGNVNISAATVLNSNLNILSGSALNLNNNSLTLKTVTGTGTLTGSSTSNLTLGGGTGTLNFTQTSASTRSINNSTFNSGATATLGDALDVYGDIEFTPSSSNSFDVNAKNLTLKSNDTYTARIGNLTGTTLSGATNVTVERFFNLRTTGGVGTGLTGRAYRLIAPTVNTTGHATKPTRKDNWMEGVMNTAIGTNINSIPAGYGLQITGSGGNTNGFDVTQSNAASLYYTNNAVTPTYSPVPNTSAALDPLTGYFLYVRGDRSMDMTIPLTPGTMPTSSTTLRATGIIQTGDKSTFTNAFLGGAGTLNLVTNPYPSPINWTSLYNEGGSPNTTISNAYTYWDPNVGNRGGFVTVNDLGGVTNTNGGTAGGNLFIQSGQAFFVQASGAAAPALTIKETHKAPGDNDIVFFTPPPPLESFRTSLFYTETNNYRQVADGALAIFGNYNTAVDNHDAFEINNWDENIAMRREGKNLAIESRPVILTKDTIYLFMNNMKERAYEFQFEPLLFTNIGLKAELIDNFLNTRTLLSVVNTTVVPFTVTADPASKATDRFKVVFGSFGGLAVDVLTIKAQAKNNGVQVDWTSKTETDMASYEVERSAFGTSFTKVNTTNALGNSTTPVSYNWFDANPVMGTNFYRVKGIDKAGNTKYSDIVRVTFGKGEPGISVYPNPVEGRSFKMDMNNLAKGTYLLNLYNSIGQLLYSEQLQHDGIQVTRTINLETDIAKGAYQLQLSGSGFKTTQTIYKN